MTGMRGNNQTFSFVAGFQILSPAKCQYNFGKWRIDLINYEWIESDM